MKNILIIFGSAIVLIGALVYFSNALSKPEKNTATNSSDAIVMEKGKQIITVTAHGGYQPRTINAKAGLPTIIRMKTESTFDCSASLTIPAIGYQKFLQPTGTEDVALTATQAHGELRGICSMGMYSFTVRFE